MKHYLFKDNKEVNFNFMLWIIIALIVGAPIAQEFSKIGFLFKTGITLTFISGIYGLSKNKKRTIIATIFYIPMFLTTWSDFLPPMKYIKIIGNLSGFILICGLIYFIFKKIGHARKVTMDLIKAAITAYLLMGFAWALPYLIIFFNNTNAFSGIDIKSNGEQIYQSLFYFSYVTLTTLGYGDIYPITGIARSLAIVEAIVGQLYLVVIISWLVGLKVGQDLKAE
jgi:hypothetical protein